MLLKELSYPQLIPRALKPMGKTMVGTWMTAEPYL
jgi:hypothetical protein